MAEGPVIVSARDLGKSQIPDLRPKDEEPGPDDPLPPPPKPKPAMDLELELMHSNHLSVKGELSVSTQSHWQDDRWRLRIKRKGIGPPKGDYHAYQIKVRYTSLLPILERRIPISFFKDGFWNNYNSQQYLQIIPGPDNNLMMKIRSDLAFIHGLFQKEIDDLKDMDIPIVPLAKLTVVNAVSTKILLHMGGGTSPDGGGNAPFISIQVDFEEGLEFRANFSPIKIVSQPAFTVNVRFYITLKNGNLIWIPQVFIFGEGVKFRDQIRKEVQKWIEGKIAKPEFQKLFVFFQHWLIGEKGKIGQIAYVPSAEDRLRPEGEFFPGTGHIFLKYVGKTRFRRITSRSGPPPAHPSDSPSGGGASGKMMLTVTASGYGKGQKISVLIDGKTMPTPAKVELDAEKSHLLEAPFLLENGLTFDKWSDGIDLLRRDVTLTANTNLTAFYIHRLFDIPKEDPDEFEDLGEPPSGDPTIPGPLPNIGNLKKIDHIVILMQENRSFDQVLGYLSRDGIKPEVDGLAPVGDPKTQDYANPVEIEGGIKTFFPQQTERSDWPIQIKCPGHGARDVAKQIADGKMNGFAANFLPRAGKDNLPWVMAYFGKGTLKTYDKLVETFGIGDRWYCSFAGGTMPNRFIMLTGKLNKDPLTGELQEDNPGLNDIPGQAKTIFDYLTEHNVSWRVFEHGYSATRFFKNHTFDTTNILPFNDPNRGFEATAKTGLPSVTLIEPDYIELPPGNDDHAPADMLAGQELIDRVVRAVVNSPGWERTLLVITYDEHGGFFDHRRPPLNEPSIGVTHKYMGPRVPAFFISPLVPAGKVFKTRFEHTSITASILRRFCNPDLKVSPRVDSARDLGEVLELEKARPREEFGAFNRLSAPNRMPSAERKKRMKQRSKSIGVPSDYKEDFKWYLSLLRLITGQPPTS